jgi:hypothetical protein
MNYAELNINQRINCRGNAEVLYTTFNPKYRGRLPYGNMVFKRITKASPGMFVPSRLLPVKTN